MGFRFGDRPPRPAGGGLLYGGLGTSVQRSRWRVLRPLPELVAELNDFRPTALEGYPSAAALLAAEQKAGRLRVNPVLILTAGEDLSVAVGADVETTFGCPIVNSYGSAEFVTLAVQCRHGLVHVNSDWFPFEPVDENYRPVAPGVTSHTVLVMPPKVFFSCSAPGAFLDAAHQPVAGSVEQHIWASFSRAMASVSSFDHSS